MQNKTDKGTSLVSKSLPVVNSNSVNRLFSARKKKHHVSPDGRLSSWLSLHPVASVAVVLVASSPENHQR